MSETQVRELLRAKAEEMRIDPRMPRPVLRRARRRRMATVLVAGVVAAGVALGGMAGLRAVLVAEPPVRPADPQWRGIWPQATRAEAESAQACADRGDPECTWQLDANLVVDRYATEQLNWRDVLFITYHAEGLEDIEGGDRELPPRLLADPGPLFVTIADCSGRGRCDSATLVLERLLRTDGIWSIASVRLGTLPPPPTEEPTLSPLPIPPPEEFEIRDFAQAFLDARLAGSGAEEFLSGVAADQYSTHEGGLYLYGEKHDPGLGWNYGGGGIVSVEAVDANSYEVVVGLRLERDGDHRTLHETLFVGPDDSRLMVRGAMRNDG